MLIVKQYRSSLKEGVNVNKFNKGSINIASKKGKKKEKNKRDRQRKRDRETERERERQ